MLFLPPTGMQIPKYLGGKNDLNFPCEKGPWLNYDIVDSTEPGAIVGVRRKDDPQGDVFTP